MKKFYFERRFEKEIDGYEIHTLDNKLLFSYEIYCTRLKYNDKWNKKYEFDEYEYFNTGAKDVFKLVKEYCDESKLTAYTNDLNDLIDKFSLFPKTIYLFEYNNDIYIYESDENIYIVQLDKTKKNMLSKPVYKSFISIYNKRLQTTTCLMIKNINPSDMNEEKSLIHFLYEKEHNENVTKLVERDYLLTI